MNDEAVRSYIRSTPRAVGVTNDQNMYPGDRDVKQVIVIRRDLKMRRGKEIAQGAHASQLWLVRRLRVSGNPQLTVTDAQRAWLEGSFAKVVCQVPDSDALMAVLLAARAANLEAHAVIDQGRTEFHGRATTTAIAIGPDYADLIDPVTKDLELY